MNETRERLKHRIFLAAKDGMALELYTALQQLSENVAVDVLNETVSDENNQQLTPLMIMAGNGHEKAIRLVLAHYKNLDLECEGVFKIDGHQISGMTALWIAACLGHLSIVKALVKAGANVNHGSKTNSTPLRAACFENRLDIVEYLIAHKADVNIANRFNSTCLMVAAFKGYYLVVRLLLEKGAQPNVTALCGSSALHFAAECGDTGIATDLIQFGATLNVHNSDGLTPVKTAAMYANGPVAEYLLDRSLSSETCSSNKLEIEIEIYELLGASYINSKDNINVPVGYQYLIKAMELRNGAVALRKPFTVPNSAYANHIECQTLNELKSIEHNSNALYMEALVVRERILGRNQADVPQAVIYRGAVYADNGQFERCLQLWLYALRLRQSSYASSSRDLLRFAEVFSQMLHLKIGLQTNKVIQVLAAAVTELERNRKRLLLNATGVVDTTKDSPETILEELESNLTTTLYLIAILTKVLAQSDDTSVNEEMIFSVNRLIFTLNELELRLRDGQSLLHLACNADMPVDDFYTNTVCVFPCADTVRLLIKCGADVNAMDSDRNTPLHLVVCYQKPISDFRTLHSIITDLIEAGAHLDSVNAAGKTPLETAISGSIAEMIMKTQSKLCLKCMAANAVKHHQIVYRGHVPRALESFIELHGP